jgi:hypothetical protein
VSFLEEILKSLLQEFVTAVIRQIPRLWSTPPEPVFGTMKCSRCGAKKVVTMHESIRWKKRPRSFSRCEKCRRRTMQMVLLQKSDDNFFFSL